MNMPINELKTAILWRLPFRWLCFVFTQVISTMLCLLQVWKPNCPSHLLTRPQTTCKEEAVTQEVEQVLQKQQGKNRAGSLCHYVLHNVLVLYWMLFNTFHVNPCILDGPLFTMYLCTYVLSIQNDKFYCFCSVHMLCTNLIIRMIYYIHTL